MTHEQIVQKLREMNPKARQSDLVIYADAYCEYKKAQDNIAEHGPVVFHPRTGAPIDNPYIKTRNNASALIRKISGIKADDLW